MSDMAKKESKLPKSLTTVTTFSKVLAAILFIILPILAFKLGMKYSTFIPNLETEIENDYGVVDVREELVSTSEWHSQNIEFIREAEFAPGAYKSSFKYLTKKLRTVKA